MKILHVIDSGGFYGAEVMLVNLVTEQMQQGQQPVIASIGDPLIKEKAIEVAAGKMGLPVKIFRMRPGLNISGARQVLNYCRNEGFDIIHSHGYKCNILLGFLPEVIRKKPILTTLHGWTSTSGLTKLRIYEWLDALSLRFINRVVLVNKAMLQNPKISRLNRKKLSVVDNGIPVTPPETGNLEPLNPEIVQFCRDGFVIGSIGRYSTEKGFDILLNSFFELRDKISGAKMLLIGEGGQRSQYEAIIAEKNLSGRVMLTGYCPDAWRYLDLMNVYVISSLTEGLPITLLEAMRSKVSVVSTRVGGIPNVLQGGQGGILVSPGNSEELTQAIVHQYQEPDKTAARVAYSFARFNEKYSSKKMCEAYHNIYETLL